MAEAVERLLRDVWPVEVTCAGSVLARKARVCITTKRLYLYDLSGFTTTIAVTDPPAASRNSLFGSLPIDTERGTVYLNKGGCRCGPVRKLGQLAAPAAW